MAGHIWFLYQLVAFAGLTKIVELGTRGGESTCALLIGASETGGHVVSVDHGKGSLYAAEPSTANELEGASKTIRMLALDDLWTMVIMDDLEFGTEYKPDLDLLFIDTTHSYGQTIKELELWGNRVGHGGYILIHDTVGYPEQLQAIWEFLDNHEGSVFVEQRE